MSTTVSGPNSTDASLICHRIRLRLRNAASLSDGFRAQTPLKERLFEQRRDAARIAGGRASSRRRSQRGEGRQAAQTEECANWFFLEILPVIRGIMRCYKLSENRKPINTYHNATLRCFHDSNAADQPSSFNTREVLHALEDAQITMS
ncbi:hypothetical protein KCU90_g120, partial [Aureobasidium melanogenum]